MITAELNRVSSHQVSERLVTQQGLVHLTLVPKSVKQTSAMLSRKWMLKFKMKRTGSKVRYGDLCLANLWNKCAARSTNHLCDSGC